MAFKPVSITGTRRQTGQALGKLARPLMATYLEQSTVWAALRPWRGHAYLEALAHEASQALPEIWDELEGLAEGLRMPLVDILLWNCRGDLLHKTSDGCTSIAWRGDEDTRWIAHNEDGDPFLYGRCHMVDVRPDDAPGYISFYYPGSLPGHTFAANRAGLVQTINNMRIRQRHAGVPRMLLARAVLDCATLDDALAVLRDHPRAGGFHHTLGAAGEPRLYSVEASPAACSIGEVARGNGHANHLVHPGSEAIGQIVTDSSRSRQRHIENLMDHWQPPVDGARLVATLLDREGELPILRCSADDPDEENTLATALFEMRDGGLTLQVHDRRDQPALRVTVCPAA
ncbi:C45 family autoproteolytic acyltransferase/hydrolase [Bordetella pertussis]|nr:C45 family peptidase [Bordetella pertussis]WIQ47213.1 C45 family peptidase [Bordetella pertussis]